MKTLIATILLALLVIAGCTVQTSSESSVQNPGQQVVEEKTQQQQQEQIQTEAQDQQQNIVEGTQSSGISLEELSKHNSKSDCWVGYKGKVYDITDWLPIHPGSSKAIEPYCGTASEFEKALNSQHGTKQDARLDKEGKYVGDLA